jgi:serine/threonine-protein kinase HipA
VKRILDVYLLGEAVGTLEQDEHGSMRFTYSPEWLVQTGAIPLSHSMPLREEGFGRNESRGFFAGILPEQRQREVIAKNLGVSAGNDFALLDRIGGECAGAVTFLRRGQEPLAQKEEYRTLSAGELAEILRALPRRPLMAGDEGVRLSLAGAQEKLAIHRSPQGISIPLGGAPSTHILKPAIERFEGLVHNEAFCMRLARVIGLTVAPVEVGNIEGIDYLLVERYDRHWKSDGEPMGQKLTRIHQEDFCQALGIVPERKYQNEGGPSLKESFALLRECSSSPVLDLNALLDAVIFNALIGNHDAHGKNFSLIYSGGKTRMAPLYDLLCTTFYPELSTKMAMKVGGEYDSRKLTGANWERMAEESGLNKLMVKRRVLEMAEQIRQKLPDATIAHPTAEGVSKIIQKSCESASKRFRL